MCNTKISNLPDFCTADYVQFNRLTQKLRAFALDEQRKLEQRKAKDLSRLSPDQQQREKRITEWLTDKVELLISLYDSFLDFHDRHVELVEAMQAIWQGEIPQKWWKDFNVACQNEAGATKNLIALKQETEALRREYETFLSMKIEMLSENKQLRRENERLRTELFNLKTTQTLCQ